MTMKSITLALWLSGTMLVTCKREPQGSAASDPVQGAKAETAGASAAGAETALSADGAPVGAQTPSADAAFKAAVERAQQIGREIKAEAEAAAAKAAPIRKRSTTPQGPFLGSFTLADVAKAAGDGPNPRAEWRISDWKWRKGALVALSFQPGEFGANADALHPHLTVLENRGGKLARVAQKKLDFEKTHCANDSGEPPDEDDERAPALELDLAPYKIASSAMAIGVRFTCHNTFPAGEGSETRLSLLELRGGSLRQIFDEQVMDTNFDRPSGNETSSSATISVQREAHAGYFDLLLTRKSKTQGSDPESFPVTARKPVQKTEAIRYVWKGERYERLDAS